MASYAGGLVQRPGPHENGSNGGTGQDTSTVLWRPGTVCGRKPTRLLGLSLSPSPVEWCRLGQGASLLPLPSQASLTQPQEERAKLSAWNPVEDLASLSIT